MSELGNSLPARAPAGLCVPRFGPLAETSLLLPPSAPESAWSADDLVFDVMRDPVRRQPSGWRKPPKQFRAPGRGAPAAVTGFQAIPADDGRSATLHMRGQTVRAPGSAPALSDDGAAALADALLAADVLRESDWAGSLEVTLRRGLARFVNEEKGAAAWRMLTAPLALVYTDDAPAYSTGCRLPRWRDNFRAHGPAPLGFFGLRWQSQPRPVHVRRAVERVEAAHPGVGYGLMSLLQMTFQVSVAGYTPIWGAGLACKWNGLDGPLLDDGMFGHEDSPDVYKFDGCVPRGAYQTPFSLAALDAALLCPGEGVAPLLRAAREVFDACRRAGKRFLTLNHCQFLSWQMSVGERNRGSIGSHLIDRLDRAPVVYTVWDEARDVMTRLMDDYTEFCRSTWQYTDLTWMHCWQAGFAGREPEGGRKWLTAHGRRVQKMAKGHPEMLSFHDPEYVPAPVPDGSIGHAVEALGMVLDILGALDRLLCLLHTPEAA